MTDDEGRIFAVLDQAAAGDVGEPPIGRVMAAGRTHIRRRRAAQIATLALAVAAVVLGTLAVTAHTSATQKPHISHPPNVGPSANELAHGHWTVVAPVVAFGGPDVQHSPGWDDWNPSPGAVWDGSGLVFIGPKAPTGALEVLSYDPRANRWTTLPRPPAAVRVDPLFFGGNNQLVLVSVNSGAAASYQPATKRWTTLPRLPAKGVISLSQSGRQILAIAVDPTAGTHQGFTSYHPAKAFTLGSGGWHKLHSLPRPPSGSVYEAPGAVYDGKTYVLASSESPSHQGAVQLLRLDPDGWTPVPGTAGLPVGSLSLTSMQGAILATGASCPESASCIPKVAALIRPGRTAGVKVLVPPDARSIADYEVTGGGSTVAVSSNSYWLYDVPSGTWIRGPDRPATSLNAGAFWTPLGVVSNGGLLRPGHSASR